MTKRFCILVVLLSLVSAIEVWAMDVKLVKWFPLMPDFSNQARVYWVSNNTIAVTGSDFEESKQIRLINIRTSSGTIFHVDDSDGMMHSYDIVTTNPDDELFLFDEIILRKISEKGTSIRYLYDVSTDRITNIETEKERILSDPKAFFKSFQYYLSEKQTLSGKEDYYELYKNDNYTLSEELLVRTKPKEFMKAKYTESPLLRDYDRERGLLLFKYGGDSPNNWGGFYFGNYDGKTITNITATGCEDAGDGRLIGGRTLLMLGEPIWEDFGTLTMISLDTKEKKAIRSMLVSSGKDSFAVNHRTGQIAAVGWNTEIATHAVFIFQFIE